MSVASSPTQTKSSTAPSSLSTLKKRRRSSSSSFETPEENEKPFKRDSATLQQSLPSSLAALPPPMLSYPTPSSTTSSKPSSSATAVPATLPPQGITYYPVYTTPTGHFYIASPPLHPSSPSHPTKILPKLPNQAHHHQPQHQTTTLPPSPSSTPFTFYHPYQLSPPIHPTSPGAYQHHHHHQHQHHPQAPPAMMALPTAAGMPGSSAAISTIGLTTADQREQARKVSHSAIERRRRERINDKIMQLKQLIPTCADHENLHKMSILQSAIDYITYLKEVLQQVDSTEEEQDDDDNDHCKNKNRKMHLKSTGKSKLDLIHGKMQTVRASKSMLPKEVERYTTQFNSQKQVSSTPSSPSSLPSSPTSPTTSSSNDNLSASTSQSIIVSSLSSDHSQQRRQCLKPMDLFMNNDNTKKTGINMTSTSSAAPSSSLSSSSTSTSTSTPSAISSKTGLATPALTPKAAPQSPTSLSPPKNMSLKNLLC